MIVYLLIYTIHCLLDYMCTFGAWKRCHIYLKIIWIYSYINHTPWQNLSIPESISSIYWFPVPADRSSQLWLDWSPLKAYLMVTMVDDWRHYGGFKLTVEAINIQYIDTCNPVIMLGMCLESSHWWKPRSSQQKPPFD